MAFWNSSNLQPKRNHKAVLTLGSAGSSFFINTSYLVKSFSKPGIEEAAISEHKTLLTNGKTRVVYHPTGGYRLRPLEIVLVSGERSSNNLQANISLLLGYLGYNAHYAEIMDAVVPYASTSPMTEETGYIIEDMTAAAKSELGAQITIDELNDVGRTTAKWIIYTPIINRVVFSPISYDNEDLATIEMQLVYESFKYESAGVEGFMNAIEEAPLGTDQYTPDSGP